MFRCNHCGEMVPDADSHGCPVFDRDRRPEATSPGRAAVEQHDDALEGTRLGPAGAERSRGDGAAPLGAAASVPLAGINPSKLRRAASSHEQTTERGARQHPAGETPDQPATVDGEGTLEPWDPGAIDRVRQMLVEVADRRSAEGTLDLSRWPALESLIVETDFDVHELSRVLAEVGDFGTAATQILEHARSHPNFAASAPPASYSQLPRGFGAGAPEETRAPGVREPAEAPVVEGDGAHVSSAPVVEAGIPAFAVEPHDQGEDTAGLDLGASVRAPSERDLDSAARHIARERAREVDGPRAGGVLVDSADVDVLAADLVERATAEVASVHGHGQGAGRWGAPAPGAPPPAPPDGAQSEGFVAAVVGYGAPTPPTRSTPRRTSRSPAPSVQPSALLSAVLVVLALGAAFAVVWTLLR